MVRLQTPLGATRPSDPASPAEPTVNPPVVGAGKSGKPFPISPGEVVRLGRWPLFQPQGCRAIAEVPTTPLTFPPAGLRLDLGGRHGTRTE